MRKGKKGPTAKRYSEVFKRQLVRDLERKRITRLEAIQKYGISGGSTITGWLRRYGSGKPVRSKRVSWQKSTETAKMLLLERQKRELEQALARLTVEKVALEALIEEAQAHLNIDLKKTFGLGR